MTDPYLYWASIEANPDKPKVVVLRLLKSAFNHRTMADVMRNEARRARYREARQLKLVSETWAAVSPNAFKE